MASRRVRCTCGTRIKLAKGQPLPSCNHVARTMVDDPAFVPGPADAYQFFSRLRLVARGDGRVNTKTKNRVPTSVRLPKPVTLADARESRRVAEEIQQRGMRRREWDRIRPYLEQATAKQIEAYRSHIQGDMTFPQIADMMGIAVRSVKDRIAKARRHEQASRRQSRIA